MLATLLPGAAHVQNIHPLLVHFPLAFLLGAALFYIVIWPMGLDAWAWVALTLLLLGTASAVAAAATGLRAETGVMIAPSVHDALLEPHKWLMLTTCGIASLLSAWALLVPPFPRRGRRLFIVLLLVMVAVMARGADYGSRMVYDYNAGGNACPQPIEFGQ